MRALVCLFAALAAAAAPAQAPGRFVGTYVADVREAPAELGMSSAIELRPDGTFDWRLTMRGLALVARGEWRDDGGRIDLSNPQQVGEPQVELAGSSRDGEEGVLVSLEPETRLMASALEVELEFEGDIFGRIPIGEGEVRIPATDPPVVALRLFSEPFGYRSQPIAIVPGGDNRLTLRLVPADFGQAFFGSQSMGWTERGGTLDWRGIALRYDRDGRHATPAELEARQSLAGLYVAEMMETATALELGNDGRFVWVFSQGALDVGALGSWRREGDAILLDSDPVTPPRFALVRTEPGADRTVRIRFDAGSREALAFVDIELEYADGTRARDHLRPTGYAIPLGGDQPVAAFRLGSPMFDFRSERIALPAEGATFTFRFEPNDLGVESFRALRVPLAGDGLDLGWRGGTIHYARTDATPGALSAEAQAAAAEAEAAAMAEAGVLTAETVDVPPIPGPVRAWEAADNAPSLGLFDFAFGEPFAATIGRSSFPLNAEGYAGPDFAPGVAELRLRVGDSAYNAGRVTDLGWRLDDEGGDRRIGAVSFNPQDRLLAVGEALERARALHDWLVRAGFTPHVPEGATFVPFGLIDPYRYDERVAGWEEGAGLLADEDQGVQGLNLYMLRARGWYAQVSVINYTRGISDIPVRVPGQEWLVAVELYRDTDDQSSPDGEVPE